MWYTEYHIVHYVLSSSLSNLYLIAYSSELWEVHPINRVLNISLYPFYPFYSFYSFRIVFSFFLFSTVPIFSLPPIFFSLSHFLPLQPSTSYYSLIFLFYQFNCYFFLLNWLLLSLFYLLLIAGSLCHR